MAVLAVAGKRAKRDGPASLWRCLNAHLSHGLEVATVRGSESASTIRRP